MQSPGLQKLDADVRAGKAGLVSRIAGTLFLFVLFLESLTVLLS